MARISSFEENDFVGEFLGSLSTSRINRFWIGTTCSSISWQSVLYKIDLGLRDVLGDGSLNTSRFTYVDGTEKGREFFQAARQPPWNRHQPNNRQGFENCVT